MRALQKASDAFDGSTEKVDGSEIELRGLPDLIMGGSLFAEKRLVIIKGLSDNKTVWPVFGEWLPRVSDDIGLILVEPKLDKRTKTYKELQKTADIQEFSAWTDRQLSTAATWAAKEADTLGFKLDDKSAAELVRRSLVSGEKNNQIIIDQWRLFRGLEKLQDVEVITPQAIAEIIEADPIENVFDLFAAALNGDAKRVRQMIEGLSLNQDPYRLFGLLSGQAFQLAVLAATTKPVREVASDLGVHPFALENLTSQARRLGRPGTRKIIIIFAKTDSDMKSLGVDPWLLVEQALLKISTID